MSRVFLPTYEQYTEAVPMDYDGHINPFRDLIGELDMELSEYLIVEYENIYKKVVKENKVKDKTALYIYAFALVFVLFNKRILIVNQRKIKAFIDLNKPDFLFVILARYVPKKDKNFEEDVDKVASKFFKIIGPKEVHVVKKSTKTVKRKRADSPKLVNASPPRVKRTREYKPVKYTKLNRVKKANDPTARIKTKTIPTYLLYRTIIDTPIQNIKKSEEQNKAVYDATAEEFKAFVEEKLKNGTEKTKEELAEVKKNFSDVISKQPFSFMQGRTKRPILYKYALKFRMDYQKKMAELDEKIHLLDEQMKKVTLRDRRESITNILEKLRLNNDANNYEYKEPERKEKKLTEQQARIMKALKRA